MELSATSGTGGLFKLVTRPILPTEEIVTDVLVGLHSFFLCLKGFEFPLGILAGAECGTANPC